MQQKRRVCRARVVAKLKNACISLMRSIIKYYEDSDQVFGALSEFS
jgi:hypothetical protein